MNGTRNGTVKLYNDNEMERRREEGANKRLEWEWNGTERNGTIKEWDGNGTVQRGMEQNEERKAK